MASSKQQPVVPVEHFNEREHRRLLAVRSNAALTPVLSGLTAGQLLRWDGEAWVNDGEEGVWTPTYTTNGVGFDSVDYDIQAGRYRKMGTLVYVEIRLRTESITKGSASGNMFISGLPFPALSAPSVGSAASASVAVAQSFLVDHPSRAFFSAGTSTIGLIKRATSVSADTALVVADMGTASGNNNLILSGWYITS